MDRRVYTQVELPADGRTVEHLDCGLDLRKRTNLRKTTDCAFKLRHTPGANNDTRYSFAGLDLSKEPVVLTVP
ncbi:DUF1254 domain-containing protein [Achromobacter sp. AGC25]